MSTTAVLESFYKETRSSPLCVCVCALMVDAQFSKQLGDQFQMLAPRRVKW